MDYSKFIVSNQKEESISLQRIKKGFFKHIFCKLNLKSIGKVHLYFHYTIVKKSNFTSNRYSHLAILYIVSFIVEKHNFGGIGNQKFESLHYYLSALS